MNNDQTQPKSLLTFTNIILCFAFLILLYLTYSISEINIDKVVNLPTVDISKKISSLEETNKKLLIQSNEIDYKLDSLNEKISKTKNNIVNIYKSQENEKEYFKTASDSINYVFFVEYINNYKSSN